jgi:hypothetical protein
LSYAPNGFGADTSSIHHADLIAKYRTSLKYMFAQSIALTEAIDGKRLTFAVPAPVKAVAPAVVTNDTTAASATTTASPNPVAANTSETAAAATPAAGSK